MISDITIGQYYKENSLVHRLDARNKIILTVLMIAMIFSCKNFISMGIVALVVFLSVLLSKVPVKMFLKSLKPIIPVILFTAIINMFYVKGGQEWSFWIIKITEKGIYTAVFMAVRIILLIISSSILTYTTVPTMLTDAIERLLSPLKIFKISVHSWAMMMTLALRFIPTLIEEIERITNAQKARGADFENGNLIDRIKSLVPVLVPLFVSSFKRAYDLAFAMSCRCYTGGEGRTRMKQMKFTLKDVISLLFFSASFAVIILINKQFGALI
ncbi:MAG: energy-coupling factor transporter transmembrane protein EcfT [Clostridia bacterium]|nr:energy-coupling factor transporter transmembrane protein EcfT [Oscillospiraceae bacterium]MBQ7005226.1 energy-coupling factor transporter transmembrane protein EcfT [Clostridia bacterium]